MDVNDLTKDQLCELKQSYLLDRVTQEENRMPYYSELADADEIVPDETILAIYADIEFNKDDFFCMVGKE